MFPRDLGLAMAAMHHLVTSSVPKITSAGLWNDLFGGFSICDLPAFLLSKRARLAIEQIFLGCINFIKFNRFIFKKKKKKSEKKKENKKKKKKKL
jgi:hypothetical protein